MNFLKYLGTEVKRRFRFDYVFGNAEYTKQKANSLNTIRSEV